MDHEKTSSTTNLSFDKKFMNVFRALAEGNDTQRNQATVELTSILRKEQGEVTSDTSSACRHMEYSLGRLVRGMASPRGVARLGFAQALTQVLRMFPEISITDVLTAVNDKLKVNKTDSKGEQSQVLCGRSLTLTALVQADRMKEASAKEVSQVTQGLYDTGREKQPLQLLTAQALALLIEKVSSDGFSEGVWPLLKSDLSKGWKGATPENLLLLLKSRKYHRDTVKKKFLKKHWNSEDLLSVENDELLADNLSRCTLALPVLHPLCAEVVSSLLTEPKRLAQFWQKVVEETLMKQDTKRKLLCFELVQYALKLSTTANQVNVVLSSSIVDILRRTLSHNRHNLFPACKGLAAGLVTIVKESDNCDVQAAIVTRLLSNPGSPLFDNITHTKTVGAMMNHLGSNAALKIASLLMATVEGKNQLSEQEWDRATIQTSCISFLGILATTISTTTSGDQSLSVLQFLLLHALFEVKSADPDLKHCSSVLKRSFSPGVRQCSREAFFKTLDKLATFNPEGAAAKDKHVYLDAMYGLAQYLQALLSSDHIAIIHSLSDEAAESWKKMLAAVKKIRKMKEKQGSQMSEHHAFELLFLHLGLQLFTRPQDALDALQDVHVCHEKAFQKRRHSLKKVDVEEPEWQEVVTELLLSMLSQGNHLARVVVNSVFAKLCPHLNQASLQLIVDVLKPKSSDQDDEEDDQLAFEDDENEEDANMDEDKEEDEEEDSNIADSAQNGSIHKDDDDDGEETESEDDDEEDEEAVDERFRLAVKAALGTAAEESGDSDESDTDLDDEAMMKLDDALAAAFRGRVKDKKADKEKAQQLKHFKLRCMDLIGRFIQSNPAPGMQLLLVTPLLELIDISTKDRSLQDMANKTDHILTQLTRPRKLAPDSSLDRTELPGKFQELIQFSTKVSNPVVLKHTAASCLMVVRIMLGLETDHGPSPMKTRAKTAAKVDKQKHKQEQDHDNLAEIHKMLKKSLQDFCERRDSNISHTVLHVILQRQPSLMWPVANDLLKYAVKDDIRVFSRTQTLAILASMISKKTADEIGAETWEAFVGKTVKKLSKQLKKLCEEAECRVKYTEQLLLVLSKCVSTAQTEVVQGCLPSDLAEDVKQLKGKLEKDGRRMCNRVLGLLNKFLSEEEKQSRKKEKKEGKKRKTHNQKRKIEEARTNNEKEEDDDDGELSPVSATPKRSRSSVNGGEASPATETKRKKKKKQKKQSLASTPTQAENGVTNGNVSPSPGKKRTKKHKCKSLESLD